MQVVFKCRCFLEVAGPAILPNALGHIEKVHHTENSYDLKSQSSGVTNADRPKITVVAAGIIPRVQPKAADTLVRNP